MTYIKKLVMYGFKSFARKTELPLTSDINVVVGPNGSGKSNVTDALCFALGRISAKSMRAAKASNLIFAGTKAAGPAKEAMVEIVFDNSDKLFSNSDEDLVIRRILRKNGQSIYRINGQTRTRQDVLALLAQAGIDPNGFNIILQNEIQGFATGSPEERRKLIEEVSGISIYESRKEKSLRELERTSQKLKEVELILKERTSYLHTLEKEKETALKKKSLEADLKKYKASVIYIDLENKKKDAVEINKKIEKNNLEIEKFRKGIVKITTDIETLNEKIAELNLEIQKQTGLEQEQLSKEISDLRSEIAVLNVKKESYEKKTREFERKKKNYDGIIEKNKESIKQLQDESPTMALLQKELERKKKELEVLEEQRKKYYTTKADLKSLKIRYDDKNRLLQNYENDSNYLMKQIEASIQELFDKNTTKEMVDELRGEVAENKSILDRFDFRERELEKIINVNEADIKREKEVVDKIGELDTCPLCKNKITEEHIGNINKEILPKITKLQKEIDEARRELDDIKEKRGFLKEDIENGLTEIQKRNHDLMKLKNINDKEEQIKIFHKKIEAAKVELDELEKKKDNLENNFEEDNTLEERYETVKLEVQEISIRNKGNLDSDIQYKQKELERTEIALNQIIRDEKDLEDEIIFVNNNLEQKQKELEIKKEKDSKLKEKSSEFIKKRNSVQEEQRELDRNLSTEKARVHNIESTVNNFKVDKARVEAQIQGFETDILEYPNIEIIRQRKDILQQKARKTEEVLNRIGNVNMKALEAYEHVKKEYDSINDKVETITKEQEKIMKIIHKIDIEKKKVFLRTVEDLNIKFERNFSQISTKGQVYLQIQNKKDPFEAGIDVTLKTGHGKYFDIKSLSGGEKTMVALSLIFAIQELKPYCFYILDEIDAALDKRNASRLADFLKRYAQKGQYIVISHNDEIITNARTLFGVSMHEGVSKLTALKV